MSETALTTKQEVSPFSLDGFEHAQRVAMMLSKSDLIPKEYKGNVQNTMIALEIANRIGASPLMVMQNLYIVHGKPSWSSTFIISSVNSSGRFEPLKFDLKGEGDNMECFAWTTEKGKTERIEGPRVTMKMAKAEGWYDKKDKDGRYISKWRTMPELMIRYRAAAFFGRLYSPEILMGMHTYEETIDIQPEIVSQERPDNKKEEHDRLVKFINEAKTIEELLELEPHVTEQELDLFEDRKQKLANG